MFTAFILLLSVFSSWVSPIIAMPVYMPRGSENAKDAYHNITSNPEVSKDPFKFPMPLGQTDSTDQYRNQPSLQQKSESSNDIPSGTERTIKHSTFKATIMQDKKMIKSIKTNLSEEASYSIGNKTDISAHNKNRSISMSLDNNSSKAFNLHVDGHIIPVKYELTGLFNKLLNMSTRNDGNTTLLINMISLSPGTLKIQLERNLIDFKAQNNKVDSPFAVLENGVYTSFNRTENNNHARVLMISFSKGTTQIAIVGPHISPEYVNSTILLIYGISIIITIIIIILFARYNWFSFLSLDGDQHLNGT